MDITIKYRYERTGNYPGAGKALSADLARHHILSYPFMRSFAVVTFWYIATHGSNSIAKQAKEKLDNFYRVRKVGGWFKTCEPFNNQSYLEDQVNKASSFLSWICWAESNLFIGPAGRYRLDDPSQRMDKFPLYMDDRVKIGATRVKEAWVAICNSSVVGEEGAEITLNIKSDKLPNLLPNFVEAFVDYICLSQPGKIYRSAYREWAAYSVAVTGKLKPHQFWLDLSQPNNDIKDKHYKFALRDKAAKANEPWVCIKKFDDNDTVVGIEMENPGSREYDKTF